MPSGANVFEFIKSKPTEWFLSPESGWILSICNHSEKDYIPNSTTKKRKKYPKDKKSNENNAIQEENKNSHEEIQKDAIKPRKKSRSCKNTDHPMKDKPTPRIFLNGKRKMPEGNAPEKSNELCNFQVILPYSSTIAISKSKPQQNLDEIHAPQSQISGIMQDMGEIFNLVIPRTLKFNEMLSSDIKEKAKYMENNAHSEEYWKAMKNFSMGLTHLANDMLHMQNHMKMEKKRQLVNNEKPKEIHKENELQ